MPTYVALITGCGEGCDYTLACNKTWEVGTAESKEAFLEDIREQYEYGLDGDAEPRLDVVEIFEINGTGTRYDDLYHRYMSEWRAYQEKKKEDDERKQYEKLKEKFEK